MLARGRGRGRVRGCLAGALVRRRDPGAGGVRSVTRQMRIWRVPVVWYALALIGPIILLWVAEVFTALQHRTPPAHWMVSPSFSGPGGLYFVIFGSLFAEEPGWRGFTLNFKEHRDSLGTLTEMGQAEVLAVGHGEALTAGAAGQVRAMLKGAGA